MKMKPPVRSPPNPVALTVSVKTYQNDWWLSGTNASTSTINATPTMCQYAEIVFRSAVIRTLNRLITSAATRKMMYSRKMYSLVVRVVEPEVQKRRPERREAVADRCGDGDLPDEVEPAGEPAPRGRPELRGPVVETPGRRVRRRDLGHREGDDRAHEADDEPAPGDRDRPALPERDVVRGQTAGEDRDDREADREVLEPAHPPEELLGIAELVEDLLVLRGVVPAVCGPCAHCRPPLCRATPAGIHPGPPVRCQGMSPIATSVSRWADGGSRIGSPGC